MGYQIGNVPSDASPWLVQELRRIQEAQSSAVDAVYLRVLNAAPTKVREGMVVQADGTNWNPGSGAGVYAYYSGAWRFLG